MWPALLGGDVGLNVRRRCRRRPSDPSDFADAARELLDYAHMADHALGTGCPASHGAGHGAAAGGSLIGSTRASSLRPMGSVPMLEPAAQAEAAAVSI